MQFFKTALPFIMQKFFFFRYGQHPKPFELHVIYRFRFYVSVSEHHKSILYKEPTRCNFGGIVY